VKYLDRYLRDRRIGQAARWVPLGARVLDVGCHDGALFRALGWSLGAGLGLDAALVGPLSGERYELVPGSFPQDVPADAGEFDAITMAAVFEHVPLDEQAAVVDACWRYLTPGGVVILTVPAPLVDPILDVLSAVRVLDGMEHHQHFGFRPADLGPLFTGRGFELTRRSVFQLGLNNLFVFTKPADASLG